MELGETTPPPGGFVISGAATSVQYTLRTITYIDGFNLYFGCLKSLPHCRWLDVWELAQAICKANNPASELTLVRYFTAPIGARLSKRGSASVKAQQDYLRALSIYQPNVDIIQGKFFYAEGQYHENIKPLDLDTKVSVIRAEEKQTDVNIAVHMMADAADGLCDQQILISNDSDCAPALAMIRKRHPDIVRGVIAPLPNIQLSNKGHRRPSNELTDLSSWTRESISEDLLTNCQLPDRIPTRKRPIDKPAHWC